MGLSYPPEPWDLHGQAVASTFLVPVRNLDAPPPGTRVVSLLGRAVVTTAFFRYEEPSPLTYDEVMATVLVRQGLRPRVWITHIWVDSPASRDGGRALWRSRRTSPSSPSSPAAPTSATASRPWPSAGCAACPGGGLSASASRRSGTAARSSRPSEAG